MWRAMIVIDLKTLKEAQDLVAELADRENTTMNAANVSRVDEGPIPNRNTG